MGLYRQATSELHNNFSRLLIFCAVVIALVPKSLWRYFMRVVRSFLFRIDVMIDEVTSAGSKPRITTPRLTRLCDLLVPFLSDAHTDRRGVAPRKRAQFEVSSSGARSASRYGSSGAHNTAPRTGGGQSLSTPHESLILSPAEVSCWPHGGWGKVDDVQLSSSQKGASSHLMLTSFSPQLKTASPQFGPPSTGTEDSPESECGETGSAPNWRSSHIGSGGGVVGNSCMAEVLRPWGLQMYGNVLEDLGYDDPSVLGMLGAKDTDEMLCSIKANPGHRIRFRRLLESQRRS